MRISKPLNLCDRVDVNARSLTMAVLATLLWCVGSIAPAQTNTGTAGVPAETAATNAAPEKLDASSFRMVSERNIFNANRSGGTVRLASSRRPARVEYFALVGTMAYEKGVFAFFDGSNSDLTKAVKPGGVIAGHKIVDVVEGGVQLEVDGKKVELPIGTSMRREDEGAWHVAEISASDYAPRSEGEVADGNGRSSQNGRNGEESRWRRGNGSDRSSGSAAASASPSAISTAEQSEILRKLKERREKESQ